MGSRFHKHLYGGSGSLLVWRAVEKYGLSSFGFVVAETLPGVISREENSELLALEDKYIGLVKPEYNLAPQAGNTFGYRHTEDTKARMKANYSSERREAAGNLNRGTKLSPEVVEKIRQAALNRPPMSEGTR